MSSTAIYTQVAIPPPTDELIVVVEPADDVRKPKRRKSGAVIALRKDVELATFGAGGDLGDHPIGEQKQQQKNPRRQSYKLASSFEDDIEIPVERFANEEDDDERRNSLDSSSSSVGLLAYLRLLYQCPMYRAYFVSHFCQNMGDWFVRIASILVVEEFSNTGKTIAHLTLCTLLPKAIFSQVGGVIADRYDRRVCMVLLDLLSGVVVLGYLVAIHYGSLNMIYVVTILRSTLGATYYPITTGMVPLLVPNPHDLQLAVTLNSFAWSITSIIGGLVAGGLMSHIGFASCYYIDSLTFFISAAWIYWGVSGNFSVHKHSNNHISPSSTNDCCSEGEVCSSSNNNNALTKIVGTFAQVARYLWVCGFGLLVLQKCSASFVWGIEDIVGAEFTTVFREDGTENEGLSSWHMGVLFSVIGAGCIVGPALVNLIADARQPHTLQRACWIGYCFLTLGWLLISTAHTFSLFLVFSFIRVMGSGIAWVNSTLLLQTLVEPTILGRVLAVEYTLMTLLEATSASISGNLFDRAGFSKNELALFGASLGILMVLFWGLYYWFLKGGAADPNFSSMRVKTLEDDDDDDDKGEEATESTQSSSYCGLELEPELELA